MSAITTIAPALLTCAIACVGAGSGIITLAHRRATKQAVAETLASVARHDFLTGLSNRGGLDESFARRSARLPEGRGLALAVFHVAGLEGANALHGYGPCDDLLIETARGLSDEIGVDGFVARLDGAKFAVVIEVTDDEQLIRKLQALRVNLDRLIEKSELTSMAHVTVGAAVAPGDGEDCDQLVKNALTALEWARTDAAERLAFFEPAMSDRIVMRAAMERDLKAAIRADRIEPYFQPMVRLKDGQIQSYEVLARWFDDKRGAVSPEIFIADAERYGLIDTLTFKLLKRACLEAQLWAPNVRLSINAPPSLLSEPGFAFRVLSALSASAFPAARLEVEITETGHVSDLAQTRENIAILRGRGVRVALDDFGVGYSGFARLRDIPADIVKIDQSFVADMLDHEETREIVASIIRLARTLDIDVVAEGVETAAHATMLERLGCGLAQGYFFAPAQDAKSVTLAQSAPEPMRDGRTRQGVG